MEENENWVRTKKNQSLKTVGERRKETGQAGRAEAHFSELYVCGRRHAGLVTGEKKLAKNLPGGGLKGERG